MCSSFSVSVSSGGGGACLHFTGLGMTWEPAWCVHGMSHRLRMMAAAGWACNNVRCMMSLYLGSISPPGVRVEVLRQEELPGRDLRAKRIGMVSSAPEQLVRINYACARSTSSRQQLRLQRRE